MAEQKNHNNELNVEDALTQSEAFLVKNKKAIIGAVVAVIVIVAGAILYKNFYAEPREEKAQAAQHGDRLGADGDVARRKLELCALGAVFLRDPRD